MNSIVLDSSECCSDLCILCAYAGTDKSPHNLIGHRHPYSVPYSLLFESMRHKPIKFAEIGIYRGSSMLAWRGYFSCARLYGYDLEEDNVAYVASHGWPDVTIERMDASRADSIHEVFTKHTEDGELFDIILDDASHFPQDQMVVIRNALKYLRQGGMLIIEDISRDASKDIYKEAFESVKDLVSFHTFIVCDHVKRYSPEWNNDKLLVLFRA